MTITVKLTVKIFNELLRMRYSGHRINWLQLDCSVLEMLIALANRASFASVVETGDWFYKFLDNLKLRGFTDAVYNRTPKQKSDILSNASSIEPITREGWGPFPECRCRPKKSGNVVPATVISVGR
jgi:hypothetical protein